MKVYLNVTSGSTNWGTGANWSNLNVPVSADEVTLQNSSAAVDVNTGMLQTTATNVRLDILSSFTGSIGMAQQTALKAVSSVSYAGGNATATCTSHGYSTGDILRIAGCVSSQYNGTFSVTTNTADTFTFATGAGGDSPETETAATSRKEDYLCLGASEINIGAGSGSGSGRLKLSTGSGATTVYVIATNGTASDSGMDCVRLLGTNANNVLTVVSGKVGIATGYADEAATYGTVSVIGQGATFNGGTGLTLTNANISAGSITLRAAATNATITGGTLNTMAGDYAITTASVGPGTLNAGHLKTGTDASISTLYIYDGGTLDLSDNPATTASPFRVTDLYRYPGGTIKLNPTQPQSLVVTNYHDVGVGQIEIS